MERIVYNTICTYTQALEKLGYVADVDTQKALVLSFYWDYIYNMPGHILKRDEYMLVEKALDCLYGSTCLIPYPDYLKMGKLHIGEMTEMAHRVKTLEETEVLKAFDGNDENSDIMILSDDSEESE